MYSSKNKMKCRKTYCVRTKLNVIKWIEIRDNLKMFYFVQMDKKVYASLTWIILSVVMINGKLMPLTEDVLLENFIKQYVQPFVESQTNLSRFILRQNSQTPEKKRTANDNETFRDVLNFIVKRVDELKPFLQDDTVEGDNLTVVGDDKLTLVGDDKLDLEGEDETTIIEFIPKLRDNKKINEETKLIEDKAKDFQENLQKYKKLRSKIRKALKRENITKKTKNLITKTLDKMIAQMIAHKCTWKDSMRISGLMDNNDTDKSATLVKSWNEMWHKLKHQYKSKDVNTTIDADLQKDMFLNKFQDLVSVMTSDLNTMVSKYKVVCRLENLYGKNDDSNNRLKHVQRSEKRKEDNNFYKADLRTAAENAMFSSNFDDSVPCVNFRICSEELKDFLLDFYITLNETTIGTINNYAAMFSRDVSDDGYHEKERVIGLVKAILKPMEKKIDLIFRQQIKDIKLDRKKNQYVNVKALNNLVSKTIKNVIKSTHKQTKIELKTVKDKLMLNIQKDIDVNLELDLGNLERDITSRICHIFELCNGKVFSRKTSNGGSKDNVYVKVQLNLVDDEENRRTEATTVESQTEYKQLRVIVTKFPLKYSVTRTVPSILEKIEQVTKDDDKFNDINSTPNALGRSKRQKRVLDFIEAQDVTVKITLLEDKTDTEIKPKKKKKVKRSHLRRKLRQRQMRLNSDNNINSS